MRADFFWLCANLGLALRVVLSLYERLKEIIPVLHVDKIGLIHKTQTYHPYGTCTGHLKIEKNEILELQCVGIHNII